jgi:hypothetical protein
MGAPGRLRAGLRTAAAPTALQRRRAVRGCCSPRYEHHVHRCLNRHEVTQTARCPPPVGLSVKDILARLGTPISAFSFCAHRR